MNKFQKSLFLALAFCLVFSSCKKEEENQTDPNLEAAIKRISESRWKFQYSYTDTCSTASEVINGQEYLNFTSDFKVNLELDLSGETYSCSGESFALGTWQYIDTEYYYYPGGSEDSLEIEITEDDAFLCYVTQGDQTCLIPE